MNTIIIYGVGANELVALSQKKKYPQKKNAFFSKPKLIFVHFELGKNMGNRCHFRTICVSEKRIALRMYGKKGINSYSIKSDLNITVVVFSVDQNTNEKSS